MHATNGCHRQLNEYRMQFFSIDESVNENIGVNSEHTHATKKNHQQQQQQKQLQSLILLPFIGSDGIRHLSQEKAAGNQRNIDAMAMSFWVTNASRQCM